MVDVLYKSKDSHELKKQLENLDDETELRIIAQNSPPYIVEFRIVPILDEAKE
jgi:hypothetical protein